jgi:hexulose-6-phosphate isomerase
VVGVHFKDFRRAVGTADGFVDLLEGDVNWPGVMAALRTIGYDGALPAELIPLYQREPMVRVANASRAMDAILAM